VGRGEERGKEIREWEREGGRAGEVGYLNGFNTTLLISPNKSPNVEADDIDLTAQEGYAASS
jgi:uncharacterized protein YkuJ